MGNKPKANLYSTKNQWVPNYCKHSGDALKKKEIQISTGNICAADQFLPKYSRRS